MSSNSFANHNNSIVGIISPAITSVELLTSSLIFFIPLIFSGPQLVMGTIVNACLLAAAENLTFKKMVPLAILPSVAAILHGVVLGSFTPFLVYLAPFIWLSNLLLILSFQRMRKLSAGFAIGAAAGIKALFLFSVAWLLVNQQVLPTAFLSSMGMVQLTTALLGGGVAKMAHYLLLKFQDSK